MGTSEPSRHLRPTSKGVLHWLSAPERSPERCLFERLVLAGAETPLNLQELAHGMNMTVKDLARTLFALNRTESVSVREDAPDRHAKGWEADGLAGLSEELASMTRPGQRMVLSTHDGFQVARTGCGAYEADVIAVSHLTEAAAKPSDTAQAKPTRLYAGGKEFVLSSSAELDRTHPAWMRLAYRLLSGLKPFEQGTRPC